MRMQFFAKGYKLTTLCGSNSTNRLRVCPRKVFWVAGAYVNKQLQQRVVNTMSVITRHLPWFIRDPAISIVGQVGYT
jgi:hypothetical protein